MILILGRFEVQASARETFLAFAREAAIETRQQPGCLHFDMCESLTAPNHFVMLEKWQDRATLGQHFTTPAYAEGEERLAAVLVGEPQWEEYEV